MNKKYIRIKISEHFQFLSNNNSDIGKCIVEGKSVCDFVE